YAKSRQRKSDSLEDTSKRTLRYSRTTAEQEHADASLLLQAACVIFVPTSHRQRRAASASGLQPTPLYFIGMLFSISILIGLCTIAADMHHYRRMRREGAGTLRRRLFIVWASLTNSLPLVVAVTSLLLCDHSTTYIRWSMWIFWVWIIALFPRIGFYALNALHRPRLGILAGFGIAVLMIWGATAGRTTLRINKIEVCSERLPASFDGLRIVQLTDIHVGTLVHPDRELQRLVDSVNALKPDLIVFTGDLVNIRSSELEPDVMQILARFAAPVYSVTGNHDIGSYIKDTMCLLIQSVTSKDNKGSPCSQESTGQSAKYSLLDRSSLRNSRDKKRCCHKPRNPICPIKNRPVLRKAISSSGGYTQRIHPCRHVKKILYYCSNGCNSSFNHVDLWSANQKNSKQQTKDNHTDIRQMRYCLHPPQNCRTEYHPDNQQNKNR
ncbi:MAG: metallophosphoesterase, partial [Alistipes sp.]|nr:metallophosphoesterase [Alistipes sp.]